MPRLVIKNGRVINPATRHDAIADVAIEDGLIAAMGTGLDTTGAEVFDASGLVVTMPQQKPNDYAYALKITPA